MEYALLFRVFFCVLLCGLACGQSSPLNVAALQGTDVQFMCTKQAADGSTAIITWNLLPMSQRNNNPWQETTVAIAGNVILSQSKYTVTTSGNIETLHIPNVTREDAAVVECHRVNDVKKRAQLVILESPVCTTNVSGVAPEYVAGEFVSFTCRQDFHQDVWAPRMKWSWVSPNNVVPSVNETDGTKAEYTAVIEMIPEYNGQQLKCDISYEGLPAGTYPPIGFEFATNVPTYSHEYRTPGSFVVLYEVRNFEILNRKSEYNPDETITCRAEGNPKPTVTWYDANGTPVIGTATSISEFTVNTILTIDAGMEGNHSYTCNASNSINNRDTVVSATIDFTVIIPTIPPSTEGPSSAPVETCENRPATVDGCCKFDRCELCKLQTGATTCYTQGQTPSLCSSNQCPAGGLSAGAIAGIVIGVILLIILILLILYCCCVKQAPSKGKQQNNTKPKSRMDGVDTIRKPDVYAVETPPPYSPYAQPPMHHPPGNENLTYANLALDDTPRSRKPIQVYEPSEYADLQRV